MPIWMLLTLFLSIVAVLVVIVRWELRRVQNPPTLVAGAFKRYLDSDQAQRARVIAPPTGKRGFDS